MKLIYWLIATTALIVSTFAQTPDQTRKIWADSIKIDSSGTFIDISNYSRWQASQAIGNKRVNGIPDSSLVVDSLGIYTTYKELFYGKGSKYYLGFTFNNNQENLIIMYSEDAINFRTLVETGYGNGQLRDPAAIMIGNEFYVVYTSGNFGSVTYCTVIKSSDLVNWTPVDSIEFSGDYGGITRTWSPRWYVDEDGLPHIIVGLKRYTSTDFQMYEIHPLDKSLTRWSKPQWLSGDFPRFYQDGTIIDFAGSRYFFYNNYELNERKPVSYSKNTSGKLMYNWVYQDSLFGGYEGPSLVQRPNGDWIMYFDDLISGGTDGVEYTISSDTFQTWTTPTPVLHDRATIINNMRVLAVDNSIASLKDFSAFVSSNSSKISTDSAAIDGYSWIKRGTIGTPDTLFNYIDNSWQKFASSEINLAKPIFADTGASTRLWMTFNDSIVEHKGHSFTLNGPMDKYVDGPNAGMRALYFDGSSKITIADTTSLDFDNGESWSVFIIFNHYEDDYAYLMTKRSGSDGWNCSIKNANNQLESFVGDGTLASTGSGPSSDTLKWHLAAWGFNAVTDTVTIFLDGQWWNYDDFSNVTGTIANSGDILIGNYGALYFKGLISEIRVDYATLQRSRVIDYYEAMKYPSKGVAPTATFSAPFFQGNGLVARWQFEGDSAEDVNNSTVTASGTPSYANGFFGDATTQAYYLDGSTDYLTINDTSYLNFNQSSFTLAALVKFEEGADLALYHTIMHKRTGTDGWLVNTHITADDIEVAYGDGTNFVQNQAGTTNLDGGSWYMIHAVYDLQYKRILVYVNGQYDGVVSIASVTGDASNTVDPVIGKFSTNFFKGWIDELAIYNRKLTSTEIANQYNRTQ